MSSGLVERWRISDISDLRAWRWANQASCRDTEPEQWFATDARTVAELERICGGCPVRAECLYHALRHNEHGYWGGTTRKQRRRMRRMAARL